jgi:hypothetical protein
MVNYTCKNKRCNLEGYFKDGQVPKVCPNCGGKSCTLRFVKEYGEKTHSRWGAHHPRWSWSMGVNRTDIPAMKKKYPDRTYHPETGQLLVESRPHKKRLMKEHDMYEMS